MKSSFRFYFSLIIWSSMGCALTYGLADRVIKEHGGYFSFVMLSILLFAVIGMMKNITPEQTSDSSLLLAK